MKQGIFISFEGGEGVGKTTQIALLEEALGSLGYSVVKTREPGGTEGAELIRHIVKGGPPERWDGLSEALLIYAGRHDLTEKVIKPALEQGSWVLADRFFDSTFVFQGIGRSVGAEKIRQLQNLVMGSFAPTLTFFLDLPPEEGLRRAFEGDRFEKLGLEFHKMVYEAYQRLLEEEKDRFVRIDGSLSCAEVHEQIMGVLYKRGFLQHAFTPCL